MKKEGFVISEAALGQAAQQAGLESAAIIVRRLDGAPWEAVLGDPDRTIYPASMLKTPLALAAYTLVHDGELKPGLRLEVTPANMTANDKPSPLVPGYSATLEELLDLAITLSDNVATNMLYDIIGRERAGELLRERFGLRATAFFRKLSGDYPLISDPLWDGVHFNSHSLRDAVRTFELIARTRVPFAWTLRQTLARQQWNNKLSLGLKAGDQFAHKTGDTDEVTHDGGILETREGRSYVVAVYTGVPSTDENNARFGTFMQSLRPLM